MGVGYERGSFYSDTTELSYKVVELRDSVSGNSSCVKVRMFVSRKVHSVVQTLFSF